MLDFSRRLQTIPHNMQSSVHKDLLESQVKEPIEDLGRKKVLDLKTLWDDAQVNFLSCGIIPRAYYLLLRQISKPSLE